MDKKALIVFIEGADGVGKSTITNGLLKGLAQKDLDIAATHLIKHTRVGTAFYQDWTNGVVKGLTAATLMLGSTVATLEDIQNSVVSHDVIVIDRSQASFFAYQLSEHSLRRVLEPAFIETLKAKFYKECDFTTIYLECDPNIAMERMKQSRGSLDAIESLGTIFQEKIARTYQECFLRFPELYPQCTIDTGRTDVDQAIETAIDHVMALLKAKDNEKTS